MKYAVILLDTFTDYTVLVKAFTAVGAGKPAIGHARTTEDSMFLMNQIYIYVH